MNPKVSIILPSFNGERFIRSSIESCLNQTYKDIELIIVDDASSDSTPVIIQEFTSKDERTKYLRHEVNKKLPMALNTGFSSAKGEFLTWTSDDNLYRPQAIETMLDSLLSTPDVGLVYTDYSVIDEAGTYIREHHAKESSKLAYGSIIGPSFLYRREVFEKIGDYATDMLYVEDYDYWLRTARHFRMVPLACNLYSYREHRGSLTAQKHVTIQAKILETKRKNMPYIPWIDSTTKADAFLAMMRSAWSQNDLLSAAVLLVSAFRQNPARLLGKFQRLLG
jgi:glycosyltransferase involved in cell wall biosynthesis